MSRFICKWDRFHAEGLTITFLLKFLLHVIIEKVMKQHFEKNQEKKTVLTTEHNCFQFCTFVFLLLVSEVARTDRDSTLLVRNEFMVSVEKNLSAYVQEKPH